MSLTEIVILIPSHSLEDFPTEHTDLPAASLLNSFSVAWHPALLAACGSLPRWRRADEPTAVHSGQVIFVPSVCDDWLPHGWVEDARRSGATVVAGVSERPEMEAMVTSALVDLAPVAADLVADFYALGFCWLQVELLSRHMRNFSNIEEGLLSDRTLAAARAAVAADPQTAEVELRAAFELLLEARERFYPVECYLLDLCLAFSDLEVGPLKAELQQHVPLNLLATARDMAALVEKDPELGTLLADACRNQRVGLIGGEARETLLPVLPLESVLIQFQRGRADWDELVGSHPVVWGRRRYGLTASLPQLLTKLGFKAALHIALDDGIYPDQEHTKLRWRGCDDTPIDALSRIPLAADSPSSYLRFPVRMAESMDHDQVAGLIFARWPDVTSPWFHDLRRTQKYAPVLGRFITLPQFFSTTDLPGHLSSYKAHEYFPPFLIQSVARREADPISRIADHALRRRQFDAAVWCHDAALILCGQSPASQVVTLREDALEAAAPEALPDSLAAAQQVLQASLAEFPESLARLVLHGASAGARGFLIVNTLSFDRRVCVPLPGLRSLPAIGGAVKAAWCDRSQPERSVVVVEVPGSGYAWIPEDAQAAAAPPQHPPLLQDHILNTEWFEVVLNSRTGGIGHIRFHNQRVKQLSQQLSFRFPRPRRVGSGDDAVQTEYAEMRCRAIETITSDPVRAEVESTGDIVDQCTGQVLAGFRQRFRVWRARPIVELDIELSQVKVPDGDPWNNYFASRFAWNDESAAVTRSVLHAAQGFGGERFETSDFIEIAADEDRVVIVPHGLPYHRQTSRRMVDSLLIVAGETRRTFHFTLAVGARYPLEAAWNATTPPLVVPTSSGPPRSGASGWFFHVDSRNVQLTRITELVEPASSSLATGDCDTQPLPAGAGFALRMLETEGRARRVKLRTFRQPLYARKRDFLGQTLTELILEGDSVLIDLNPHEVVDVELRFGQS